MVAKGAASEFVLTVSSTAAETDVESPVCVVRVAYVDLLRIELHIIRGSSRKSMSGCTAKQ